MKLNQKNKIGLIMGKFEIRDDNFYLNDKKFRILSGAMHYFRVHPDYWDDRMQKM